MNLIVGFIIGLLVMIGLLNVFVIVLGNIRSR